MWNDPRITGHVGNRILPGDKIPAIGKLLVQHGVQARSLLHIAIDRIGDLFWRVLAEMVVLAGHRTEPAHLPEKPLQYDVPATQILRDEALGLVGKIKQDGPGLEHR